MYINIDMLVFDNIFQFFTLSPQLGIYDGIFYKDYKLNYLFFRTIYDLFYFFFIVIKIDISV